AAAVRGGRPRRACARSGTRRGAIPVTEHRRGRASDDDRRGGGAIVWFTGLPSSGKTTLARRVQSQLAHAGRAAVLLDSDELRGVFDAHSYAPGDRDRFYRALAALAALLARQR